MTSHFSKYTIDDITRGLDVRGLKWKRYRDGIMCQCPKHIGGDMNCLITPDDDGNPRAYCYSHCLFFWPDEVMEELKGEPFDIEKYRKEHKVKIGKVENVKKVKEIPALQKIWKESMPLPPERIFPEISNGELEALGWRWVDTSLFSLGRGVLIPYWTSSYTGNPGEGIIGFCQVRHLEGSPRFSFPRGMSPTLYGKWILRELTECPESEREVALCEGTHDWVVLNACGIPAVAVPSSSNKDLVKGLAEFCSVNKIRIIYAGDNDAAGNRVRAVFDNMGVAYRSRTAPHPYKDVGDFAKAEGLEAVSKHVGGLYGRPTNKITSGQLSLKEQEKLILDMFPGAEVLISAA